jgi:hypothetical protein
LIETQTPAISYRQAPLGVDDAGRYCLLSKAETKDKMTHKVGGAAAAAALLWLIACCAPSAFAEVPRTHCGVISHAVLNLGAANPRHAYWCKSDVSGYLGEDHAVRIRPYHHHWRRRVIVTRY